MPAVFFIGEEKGGKKMKIQMPQAVHFLIERLEREGCEAYAVGGCIRDSLLGREPKDWDICTSASPSRVMEIFADLSVVPTGIKHGTLTVIVEGQPYEVTTFRKDGDYPDGRRPESVDFVDDLFEDLARRDFRINAMAYNDRRGLQDPFGGRKDIEKRMIRTVGSPRLRFSEDYLRLLRALRFAVTLDFALEEETELAISELGENICRVSAERIREEFVRMIGSSAGVRALRLMESSNLLRYIFPELFHCIGAEQHHPCHSKDVWGHTLDVLGNLGEAPLCLKLAALFHDIGKVQTRTSDEKGTDHFYGHEHRSALMAEEIMRRLHFSNEQIEKVCILVRSHSYRPELRKSAVRRWIRRIGKEHLFFLLKLQEADALAHTCGEEMIADLRAVGRMAEEILSRREPMSMRELAISGRDLLAMGYAEGKEIGRIKERLLQHVLDHPEDNDREILKRRVGELSLTEGDFPAPF